MDGFVSKWFNFKRPRGTIVPFETPALRMVRVCDDEHEGLIAILQDFANNGSTYVIPWNNLPLVASMTDHDISLHKGISEARPSTPAELRAVISELALSGFLGPDAKAREVECRRTGAVQLADIELVLILHLLHSCGVNPATLLTINATRPPSKDIKRTLEAAAAAIGIKRQEIYQRIADFAKLLMPIGLVAVEGPIHPGWLRVLHGDIATFARNCTTSPQAVLPEVIAALEAISKSAGRTARLSDTGLSLIDYAVLDIPMTIRRWATEHLLLKQVINRLSMMLDPWPSLMSGVNDALRGSQKDMVSQLSQLQCVLPHTPERGEEANDDPAEEDEKAASIRRALAIKLSTIWGALGVYRSKEL
jgi:hypothetical protein